MGETLEQLWMSYNLIEKLKGITALKKLKVRFLGGTMYILFILLKNVTCFRTGFTPGNNTLIWTKKLYNSHNCTTTSGLCIQVSGGFSIRQIRYGLKGHLKI